jgi:hypothetical protein
VNTRVAATIVIIGFFSALIQIGLAFASPTSAIIGAGVLALLSPVALRMLDVELSPTAAVLLPALSSGCGVACLAFVPRVLSPVLWTAPLLACTVAAVAAWIRLATSRRCALCSRRVGDDLAFACPRCHLLVCSDCWVFEYRRCRLCEQNGVPVFTEPSWWDRELGPRVTFGSCSRCKTPASHDRTELRACRKCGRPQCAACWDEANGECLRCGWIAGGLPDALNRYMRPNGNAYVQIPDVLRHDQGRDALPRRHR